MVINNIDKIKSILTFDEDTFYFLQIIKRRKENPTLEKDCKVIKSYYVGSLDYLNKKLGEIIELCKIFNARAYINLTPRSYKKVAFLSLKKYSDLICSDNYKPVKDVFNSACGESYTEPKRWVIDIDNINDYPIILEELRKINVSILIQVPTINGIHLIVSPFNSKLIEPVMCITNMEIHKNNPTLLYYNND